MKLIGQIDDGWIGCEQWSNMKISDGIVEND